ncbi:MAG: hypothetical protein AAF492_28435, partial [Verrucomicrobiota bacterium]
MLSEQDIRGPLEGFTHRRYYTNRAGFVGQDRPNGYNWLVSEWPSLMLTNNGESIIVCLGYYPLWFDKQGEVYVGRHG